MNYTRKPSGIVLENELQKNAMKCWFNERHDVSVEMLTYIFEGAFENQYIWKLVEDYFLGIIPNDVISSFEKKSGKKLEL